MGARRVGGPERWGPDQEKVRAPRVGVRRVGARRVGPRSVGARRVNAPKAGGPKIWRFFFPLPHPFSLFFSLSGGLLVEIWWCLKRRDNEMCTFGVLESPNVCTFKGPGGFRRPPKFNEKAPREREKERKWRREREKKREILGRPAEGGGSGAGGPAEGVSGGGNEKNQKI